MRYWKKRKTNATFDLDKGDLVQVAFLQIHGGDGAFVSVSRKSDRRLIGAFLPDVFSEIYLFSYIFRTLRTKGDW